MDIKNIIDKVKIKKVYGKIPNAVTSISGDSRKITENSCFVANVGYTVDGHDFIDKVVEQGANLVIASKDKEYSYENTCVVVVREKDVNKLASRLASVINDNGRPLHTVAVTGTNGKTSITSLLHDMLRLLGKTSSYLGTNGFCKNDEAPVYFGNTTPDVVTLHNMIGQVKNEEIDNLAFEASSHAMVLGRIYNVNIDVAVFSNLTHEHLDFHGDMQTYAFDKSLLFATLGNNLLESKYGVINKDDEYYPLISKNLYHEEITFSTKDETADFYASNIKTVDRDGVLHTSFDLQTPFKKYSTEIPFIGEFMVSNVMAAMISVWLKGEELDDIVAIFGKLSPLFGRMEILGKDLPVDIVSDFAHTPDGYEKLLEATKDMREGRRTLLLTGMGGGRDISKGPHIGEIISQADYVIITTDSPRDEDVEVLMGAIEEGMTHKNYEKVWFRGDAVRRICELAEEGDVIILASKGREDYEILAGGKKVWHSDPEIALEELSKKFKK
ncbi:MAG: UDP-N-acetylmuramoyl-L-alanyl-D-glutamate--2,6-diaminopimelate ligase [Gemella sp.]|nr:UDP-N-acetylmuramoyl-L-alanyl-D-glutamate--2,6-diaminopimelate ligase [Gemella sp.]